MPRFNPRALIVAVALGAAALAGEPASATPMAGAAAIERAAAPGAEQVLYRHGNRRPSLRRRFHGGHGYRRHGHRRSIRFHGRRRF